MEKIPNEDEIITVVYNFIVDSSITEDERKVFISFKNSVGSGTNFSRALMNLSYDLRQIALKNVSKHVRMTPNVSEFYKKIVTYGQRELNWAYGLSAYGIIF